MDFLLNPDNPGHRLHKITNPAGKIYSISAGMDIRIIVRKDAGATLFLYVDHHDKAYSWAKRRKIEVHPVTGAAQIVELEEVIQEEIRIIRRDIVAPAIFAGESDDYLLSLGIPVGYLETVKSVDEDGFVELFERLPDEALEALMKIQDGKRPKPRPTAAAGADPFAHPDARRRFWIATDEEALSQALEAPWEQWLAFLHPSQQAAVEKRYKGPARISGGAGTGKTVVAIHRAAHLARNSSGGRLLLTTYSRNLAGRLSDSLDLLMGAGSKNRARIDVIHVHKLAHDIVDEHLNKEWKLAYDEEVREFFGEQAKELPDWANRRFLKNEWDEVIDYWELRSFAGYRDVERRGRGRALSPKQRKEIWPAFEELWNKLKDENSFTWAGLCRMAGDILNEKRSYPYRHVIVDEAQDLGPLELGFVARLAAESPQALFFAGDPGQQIYCYPFDWHSVGVDVRGRETRLEVNYRTSAEIMRFADRILPEDEIPFEGDPEERSSVSLLSGPEPEVKLFETVEEEVEAVSAWILALKDQGVGPQEIALFGRSISVLKDRALPAIKMAGEEGVRISPSDDADTSHINYGTFHSAKGLEFRAVALLGCEKGKLPHKRLIGKMQSEGAREEMRARERHLFYVGCTRPREHLLVTGVGEMTEFLEGSD